MIRVLSGAWKTNHSCSLPCSREIGKDQEGLEERTERGRQGDERAASSEFVSRAAERAAATG